MIKFIKYLLFIYLFTFPVIAAEINDIKNIKVEGLQRISYETVLSYGDLSIDKIYSEDDVWAADDCTKKELKDFLEQMNSSQFKSIETFFETMPKLSHKIKVTNPNTKVESEVVLEGLASFFA